MDAWNSYSSQSHFNHECVVIILPSLCSQAPWNPVYRCFPEHFPQDEFNGLIKVTLCTNWEVSEAPSQLSCIYTRKVPAAERRRQFQTQKHTWVNYFLLVCHIFLRYDCSSRRWQQQLTIKLCTPFYLYFPSLSILLLHFLSFSLPWYITAHLAPPLAFGNNDSKACWILSLWGCPIHTMPRAKTGHAMKGVLASFR